MKKAIRLFAIVCGIILALSVSVRADSPAYTVVPGDTLWKIAVRYQVGCSEIIAANPQVKNPNLIYPI